MKLEDTHYDNAETGCCARLDVARWDDQDLTWDQKRFLKDHVRAFFHVPLDMGAVARRDHAVIEAAEAFPEDPLWLSDENSLWGSDFYVAVDRDIPGHDVVSMSGRFLTKVFEGPYHDAGKWAKAMEEHVARKGLVLEQLFFYYATCPTCAKTFGHNHVVLFAKAKEAAAA